MLFPAAVYADNAENAHTEVPEDVSYEISGGALYNSVLYDSSNGLPTSEANTVLQTSDGFVWIGGYSGLIRYDGNEFYRYDASYGIPNVVSLFEDSKQRLWIGTNDSGVVCYDNGEFTLYNNIEGMKSSSVCAFAEDTDGSIIVATKIGIACIDKNDEMHPINDNMLNIEDVRELRNGIDGVIYGHTNTGSFFTMENKQVRSFFNGSTLGIGSVSAVCPDNDRSGWVYLGTSGSEIVHGSITDGMKDLTFTDVTPLVNINELSYIGGSLWICADNGIGYISPEGDFNLLTNIPMNHSIDDMMYDYEGNLWFASSRQGIMKISPSIFTDISKIAWLDDMIVNSTCVNNGIIYAGTDDGLYTIYTIDFTIVETEMSRLLSDARVRCIKNDSKGNVWFSTYSGLFCLKADGDIVTFNEENGLGTNKVRITEELSDGRIAVSTNIGVFFIKDFEIQNMLSADDGLSNTEILTICEGYDGQILLGSNGGGAYIVNGNSVSRMPQNTDRSVNEGLRSDVILRIKKDPYTDTVWIITSSSIAYMQRDGIVRTITAFPYSNNFDIFFDGSGRAWILSSNGIYVTTISKLVQNENIDYMFYDTNCGLPSVATANSRSFEDDDHNIYIAGSKGISVVNMNSIKRENSDIRLTIPFVEVDGKLIGLKDNEITIPQETQRITIYSYALTYSLNNPMLRYSLKGFDKEQTTALRSDMTPATYTNLKGGTYVFELAIIDPITGESKESTSVTVIKQKSLNEQYWFQLLMIVGIGALVFFLFELVHKRREDALIRDQQRKQLLIDEMIQAFAKCVDLKDNYTNGHSFRVAEYSKLIAKKCGRSDAEVQEVYNIALLHDIGKISIPDHVLNKNGRPTDEEYEILKTHAKNGYDVLKTITIAPELANGAGYHHERLDGKGYPFGKSGDEIPDVAQIIAVADTFDAMYSTRPYRKQMPVEDVIKELKRVSGTQLNGEYVHCLIELIEDGEIGQRAL